VTRDVTKLLNFIFIWRKQARTLQTTERFSPCTPYLYCVWACSAGHSTIGTHWTVVYHSQGMHRQHCLECVCIGSGKKNYQNILSHGGLPQAKYNPTTLRHQQTKTRKQRQRCGLWRFGCGRGPAWCWAAMVLTTSAFTFPSLGQFTGRRAPPISCHAAPFP
jgi:hypothetical protein